MDKQTIRVCFSIEAFEIIPGASRKPDRTGDGYETLKYWMVKWDDCISFQAYAKCYISKATGVIEAMERNTA